MNKEKELTIQLLTEKLQRISGKKVVLKEEINSFLEKIKQKTINFNSNGSIDWYWVRDLKS